MNDFYHGDEQEIKNDADLLHAYIEIERQNDSEIENNSALHRESIFNDTVTMSTSYFFRSSRAHKLAKEIQNSLRIIWGQND